MFRISLKRWTLFYAFLSAGLPLVVQPQDKCARKLLNAVVVKDVPTAENMLVAVEVATTWP